MPTLSQLARPLIASATTCFVLATPTAQAQTQAQSQTPTPGGILTASLFPEPPSLNPAVQQVQNTQVVGGKIFESLLEYTPDLQVKPSLAKSWDMSPDRLRWTFQLQQGVKWHDGKPFTAADVVFNYQHIHNNSSRLRTLMESLESVSAPDEHTVIFQLKRPYSAFLYAFDIGGGPILPKHLYEGKDLATHELNNAPIGTGPFKFSQWQRGSFIELVRNPDYWQKNLPYLDGITYRIIPDAASRRVALEQGQIMQMMPIEIEPSDVARLAKNAKLKSTTGGNEFWATQHWIELNNTVAPMNDKRFRQALMHAIDRQFIVDKIRFKQGTVSTGPISQKTRFYTNDVKQYDYNPKKAIALLDEMGLKPDAKGVRVTLGLIPLPYGEAHRRVAEYVRLQLSKIGVAVNLEAGDTATWVRRMANGEYQMAATGLFQYGDPAIGVARNYISSNIKKGVAFSNTAQYQNKEVDELFAQAEQAPEAERAALYAQVQKILVEDVPVLWMFGENDFTFFNKRVMDAYTSALGPAGSYARAWLVKE